MISSTSLYSASWISLQTERGGGGGGGAACFPLWEQGFETFG